MRNRYFIYGGCLVVVAMFFLGGCTSSQARLEADYGTSYKLQKFGQTLNPQAEKNLATVEGFNGQAADKTVVKYENSFAEKTAAPVYNFSISTGGK